MKVKFCGLRREEDIKYANEFMPDYVGYVFTASKRQISAEVAKVLNSKLSSKIKSVGVFVNEDLENIIRVVEDAKLQVVQLHGDESLQYIEAIRIRLPQIELWKAVRVRTCDGIMEADKLPVDKLVLDAFSEKAYGGTGEVANLTIINQVKLQLTKPFFIAGGINIGNIGSIINDILPYGIDISGGIETDGFKDKGKIKAILELIRRV